MSERLPGGLLSGIGDDGLCLQPDMMQHNMHTLYYLFSFVKPRDTHVSVRTLLLPPLFLIGALLTAYGSIA
jgi:hypothetical protein